MEKHELEQEDKERLEAATSEVRMQGALAVFNNSEAGKIMRDSYNVELAGAITDIANNATKYTHAEFIAKALFLEERINFLQSLSLSKEKYDLALQAVKDLTDSVDSSADVEQ